MKKILHSLAVIMILALAVKPVTSQELGEPMGSPEDEKAGLVSFDFKDADVRNVLRIFSHKTGINIVASPDVQGSVTVKLNNVPWEKALKIILEMNDFAYVREENVIKVLTRDRVAQEPLKTEVIALDYAKAGQILSTVESMLSERGSVKTDDRANLLIITDVPSSFDPIVKVIKRLDMPTPQVLIETKLIETTLDFQKKFGVRWDFLDEYSLQYGGAGDGGTFLKSRTDSVADAWSFGRTDDENLGTMEEEFAWAYDSDNPRFNEYTSTPGEDPDAFGYDINRSELEDYKHPNWTNNEASYTKGFEREITRSLTSTDAVSTSFNTYMSASRFQVVMSALLTDDGTDILSSPSIVTMDNTEATIKVATDFPMPSFAYNDDTGNYEITGFTPTPIGITLKVTPYVAPNGYVTMDLNPEVSEFGAEVPFASLGVSIPQISKENVKTSIMVKDGDTVVLGGLMKQFDQYSNQKVPLFHRIPFLGWFFKYKDKLIQKRNLLIFVTPTILKNENVGTITQNMADWYTKKREAYDETTELYPNLEEY
jgi:type IV pilus assembly protein PilQ